MPASAVVPKPGTVRRLALRKPGEETQTPIMHLVKLRNVPASVWEAVDSSQEQAEVGKQNKHMNKRAETTQKFDVFLYL